MIEPNKQAEEIVADAQYKAVAIMKIAGHSTAAIAKQLNITAYYVNKISHMEEYKTYLREQADKLIANAANTWRAAMDDLISDSLRVIRKKIKEDDLEAVKLVMRSIGVEKQTGPVVESGAITVVLPSQLEPKTVQSEVLDDRI